MDPGFQIDSMAAQVETDEEEIMENVAPDIDDQWMNEDYDTEEEQPWISLPQNLYGQIT